MSSTLQHTERGFRGSYANSGSDEQTKRNYDFGQRPTGFVRLLGGVRYRRGLCSPRRVSRCRDGNGACASPRQLRSRRVFVNEPRERAPEKTRWLAGFIILLRLIKKQYRNVAETALRVAVAVGRRHRRRPRRHRSKRLRAPEKHGRRAVSTVHADPAVWPIVSARSTCLLIHGPPNVFIAHIIFNELAPSKFSIDFRLWLRFRNFKIIVCLKFIIITIRQTYKGNAHSG